MIEYKKGDLIFGKDKNIWYPGKVSFIDENGSINVEYEDGLSEWINDFSRIQKNTAFKLSKISDLKEGDRIIGNWKGRGRWYEGKIKKINKKGRVYLKYDDGDKEWIEDFTRIRKTEMLDDKILSKYKKGDRIIGNWLKQNKWYPGIVRVISEGRINVQYDDGDSEWIEDPFRIQKDNSGEEKSDMTKESLYQ
ncbi:MAG: tudor domain-containing protein [Promethearchaeota archaeon]